MKVEANRFTLRTECATARLGARDDLARCFPLPLPRALADFVTRTELRISLIARSHVPPMPLTPTLIGH
jgi:hypothetical protein